MAARFLTRQVATQLTSSQLLPAIRYSVSLHTAVSCLDPSDTSLNSSDDAAQQKPAASAEVHQPGVVRTAEQQQAAYSGAGRAARHESGQQRQFQDDLDPGSGPQRTSWYQPRGQSGGLQRDPLPQRQGSGSLRGTPSKSGPNQGPRPAFIDRSNSNQGPRPAFIDRSGSSNQTAMTDQRQRPARQSRQAPPTAMADQRQRPARQARQAPPRQQGRPIPGNAVMDEPAEPDDPIQAYNDTRSKRARSQLAARRVTPGPARTEWGAPGANLRGGGPAKGTHLTTPPIDDDEDDDANTQRDEGLGFVSEDFLERIQNNPRGVPASWRELVQDPEDQEELDEARKISAFNRKRISGHVKILEDELMNDMHALEMNSDPKLEFELDSPVMQELEEPDANEILDKYKEELCSLMGIEGDEDWKEVTEGLPEEFAGLHQELHGGLIKPRIQEWSLETFVQESMPSSHPMYPTVLQSLQMLQSNPSYNHKQRFTFMRRLIKDLN